VVTRTITDASPALRSCQHGGSACRRL